MSTHSTLPAIPATVVADAISGVAVVMTWAGYLPDIAALAAVIWYGIQIYDRLIARENDE